jgi:hypothetical protein
MIELIILFFLTRSIGRLAMQKGQNPGRWKLYTVLAWIGFEFVGAFIGVSISHNLILGMLLGLGCAFGGYLLMKYQLDKMPDVSDDWLQRLGNDDQ